MGIDVFTSIKRFFSRLLPVQVIFELISGVHICVQRMKKEKGMA
jgi:hypothetical protein